MITGLLGGYISKRQQAVAALASLNQELEEQVGQPYRGVGAGQYLSEQEFRQNTRASKALEESEVRLRAILDHVQTGILIIDAASKQIVEANPTALRLIGAPREKVIGCVCHRCVCPAEMGKCPITDLGQQVDNAERVSSLFPGRKFR